MQRAIPQHWLFPPSLKEAAVIQRQLAEQVIIEDQFSELNYIAGMDVSNNPFDPAQIIHAAVVILKKPDAQIIETATASQKQRFPYVPGFLGFREAPVLVAAFQQLKIIPSLIFVDGHGISHPRGLGIASHIGVLLDCSTIGVAKSILVGEYASPLGDEPGAQTPLVWQNRQIATVLRSKKRALPLIISPGHKISLESAVNMVKNYLNNYRLPEPTRQAHLAANHCRRQYHDHQLS